MLILLNLNAFRNEYIYKMLLKVNLLFKHMFYQNTLELLIQQIFICPKSVITYLTETAGCLINAKNSRFYVQNLFT